MTDDELERVQALTLASKARTAQVSAEIDGLNAHLVGQERLLMILAAVREGEDPVALMESTGLTVEPGALDGLSPEDAVLKIAELLATGAPDTPAALLDES